METALNNQIQGYVMCICKTITIDHCILRRSLYYNNRLQNNKYRRVGLMYVWHFLRWQTKSRRCFIDCSEFNVRNYDPDVGDKTNTTVDLYVWHWQENTFITMCKNRNSWHCHKLDRLSLRNINENHFRAKCVVKGLAILA